MHCEFVRMLVKWAPHQYGACKTASSQPTPPCYSKRLCILGPGCPALSISHLTHLPGDVTAQQATRGQ